MSRDTRAKNTREIEEDSEEEENQNKKQEMEEIHTEVRREAGREKSNPGLMLNSSIISVITLNQLMMMRVIHT